MLRGAIGVRAPGKRIGVERRPGRRTLAWHPYLWSSWNALVGEPGAGQFFLIALAQDDEEDGDRDDGTDLNGVVVVRSEAVRPDGLRRSVEALGPARKPGDPGHDPGLCARAQIGGGR